MIKFNRLPPQTPDDVELSHYTRREILATLDFYDRHFVGHIIDEDMDTGVHFKINGSEIGTTICANLSELEPGERIQLTRALAVGALVKAFTDLNPAFIHLYAEGAVEGAKSEILGEQMDQFEALL